MATPAVATPTQPSAMDGAIDSVPIPGINYPLEERDLILACETYNGLLPIENQVRLQGSHSENIKDLLAIVISHGMGRFVGFHSLHRHDAIPEKTIRLEDTAPGVDGMNWTRAAPITRELLSQDQIHGSFFYIQGGTLIPFEFAKGPSPLKQQTIPPKLLVEVTNYLSEHDLIGRIAIEIKDFTKACVGDDKRTAELDVVWGTNETLTVVLPLNRMVEGVTNPVPTGWNAQDYNPESDPEGPGPGEHWNASTKPDGTKTHKVHVDSTERINAGLLEHSLVSMGYIKAG